jgi:hypothetical protein
MSDFKIVQLLNPFTINSNINPTGVYSPSTSYGPGDSVSYGNASYLCIAPTTGNVPTNTTYWQLLASASTNKLTTTVRNNTGVTVPKGSVVYFNGALGNLPTIALSLANSEATSSKTVGITATSIANNSNGEVVVFGLAESLDTSAFTVGLSLWLSPTVPGGMTTTKPSAPDHTVFIGTTTGSHPTNGTIEVRVQNGFELQELHNVSISSLVDNQVLKYDSATSLWKNETLVKADVGLGNVDDTTDLDKPISTATQTALNLITNVNWTGDYNNGVTYTVGDGVMFNGASFRMIAAIGAAGYNPVAYPGNWLQVTDYVSPNDIGLGNVNNTADIDKPVSTAQQTAIDAKVANNLTASTTVAPSKTAVNTGLALKVNKAGDTMTGSLTVTGNNGVEFPGVLVNNTNIAGYCAINARADDGEVIQIAALNSGGAANAYGMWTANQFGLYSKRTLNIMTDSAGAEIKFSTGTGGTQVAKIDATGKFSSNGMSLNSGTLENVPTPTVATDATNKDYVDTGLATKEPSLGFTPANDTLSNLGGTAVNNSINPDSNITYTLGASGLNWLSLATQSVVYDDSPNIDVQNRLLIDAATKNALDYENRHLLDKSATLVLDWDNCLIDKDRFALTGVTFETVSKNLRQYDYTLNYTSGVLTSIVYNIPSVGTITKSLNYTSGALTSVVLSGSTPSLISMTKTLTFTSGVLTSVTYS